MDKVELQNELYKLNISRDSYCIDGVEDETLCLILNGWLWCVFYSEQGKRTLFYFKESQRSDNIIF